MVFLNYPKLIISVHTHPSQEETNKVKLFRPYTEELSLLDLSLFINVAKKNFEGL